MEEIIWAVRFAFEDEVVKKSYAWFNDFPNGSCMDASIILGIILEERGLGEFVYTSAKNERGTHSWLENEKLLIDITADQFGNAYSKVMIIEKSSFNTLHIGFEITNIYPIKKHEPIPDPGFYLALSMVKNKINILSKT